ncbi:MAG: hypothetical protein GY798_28285, partial [Hyphomicrobiales bacterium]|nr:hypothetical protein [Hyphomicrobiales bacterium]
MALDPKFTAKTDSNRRFIVTTTINPPTEAIRLFDLMRDWTLIVVGDHQTPSDYRLT